MSWELLCPCTEEKGRGGGTDVTGPPSAVSTTTGSWDGPPQSSCTRCALEMRLLMDTAKRCIENNYHHFSLSLSWACCRRMEGRTEMDEREGNGGEGTTERGRYIHIVLWRLSVASWRVYLTDVPSRSSRLTHHLSICFGHFNLPIVTRDPLNCLHSAGLFILRSTIRR